MTLWHFTCYHSTAGIERTGLVIPPVLQPGVDPAKYPEGIGWMAEVAWFTDLDHPTPWQVGLTGAHIGCNRLAFRYRVTDEASVVRWLTWCRGRVPREMLLDLHWGQAMPGRWYVATVPVPVTPAIHPGKVPVQPGDRGHP